jgi:hypothetical protein
MVSSFRPANGIIFEFRYSGQLKGRWTVAPGVTFFIMFLLYTSLWLSFIVFGMFLNNVLFNYYKRTTSWKFFTDKFPEKFAQ